MANGGSRNMALGVEDIRGVVGILPTPALPGAERWDAEDTVDLTETEKMTRLVLDAGVDIVMTHGTFGEGATLTWQETQDFDACVIDTVAGRRPVFAGVTTLNTRDTVSRGRALMEAGATGLFIGRPMWLSLDDVGILHFYQDIAEAFAGVPIVMYDNPFAFKSAISTELYAELAKIPELVAAKHAGPRMAEHMPVVGEDLRLLPLTSSWLPLAEQFPDLALASWSGHVACAPSPAVATSEAILTRDWPRAHELTRKLQWAEEPMFPGGDISKFMDYSIQLGHVRFNHAGLVNVRGTRAPYYDVPEEYVEGAAECGRRYAQLEREFAGTAGATGAGTK